MDGPANGRRHLTTEARTDQEREAVHPALGWLKRYGLLVLIAVGLGVVLWFDLHSYISFETLHRHHEQLKAWVADNVVWAAAVYAVIYVTLVALSLPGGAMMTIAGGYLFGILGGTALAATGATLGATIIFIAARNASRDFIRKRAGRTIRRIESGFKENMVSYMLFLRLVPVFPFFAINLAMAFLGVPLRLYVLTTFFGIMPGSAVYASVGNGMGALLDIGRKPSMGIIFEPEILLPILALAALSLVPVGYRYWRRRRRNRRAD